jgi:hypothetical protein
VARRSFFKVDIRSSLPLPAGEGRGLPSGASAKEGEGEQFVRWFTILKTILLAPLLFRLGLFLFFVAFLLLGRFLVARLLAPRFFTTRFGAAFALQLAARDLYAAQGAAEVLDFAFVVELLVFGQFDQLQDVLHFFQRFFERGNNSAHLLGGPGNG